MSDTFVSARIDRYVAAGCTAGRGSATVDCRAVINDLLVNLPTTCAEHGCLDCCCKRS